MWGIVLLCATCRYRLFNHTLPIKHAKKQSCNTVIVHVDAVMLIIQEKLNLISITISERQINFKMPSCKNISCMQLFQHNKQCTMSLGFIQ